MIWPLSVALERPGRPGSHARVWIAAWLLAALCACSNSSDSSSNPNAPFLHASTPPSGPSVGSTPVSLIGVGFSAIDAGTPTVTFGGVPATGVSILFDTTVTCTPPPGTPGSVVDIVLTNGNGTTSLPGAFRYHLPPTTSGVGPTSGTSLGGDVVSVSGSGFEVDFPGPNIVSFGGITATNVTVIDDTTLTCETPTGVPGGIVDIIVTNVNGTTTLPSAFRNHLVPTVTGVSPASSTFAGGTSLTVTGTGFQVDSPGPNTVLVGGVAATGVSVVDDTTLTCTVPLGTPNTTVDVEVSNANGAGPLTAGFFFHPLPTVAAVAPPTGNAAGSENVTVTGTGFQNFSPGTPSVLVGGNPATNVLVIDDTMLTCDTPPGVIGSSADIQVTTNNGSASLVAGYFYSTAPSVSSLAPDRGALAGGSTITVTGSGFVDFSPGTNTLTIDGVTATILSIIDDSTLTCTLPVALSGPGAVDVGISNANGSFTLTGGFTYNALPTLTTVSPAAGPGTGAPVTLTGTGFLDFAAGTNVVTFDGVNATGISVISDTSLQCLAPAGTPGTDADVIVTNDNGSATLVAGFRYALVPTVSAVTANSGPAAGGATVTLTGTGFQVDSPGTNVVTFDGVPATGVVVSSDTSLDCTVPAGTAGASVDVVLSNNNGSDTLIAGYSFHSLPTVLSLDVTSGPSGGGTAVAITGTGFQDNSPGTNVVTFDGNPATVVSVPNDTTLNVTAPAGTAGASVDVVVTNANGSDSLTGVFTYHPQPTLASLDVVSGTGSGGTTVNLSGTGFQAFSPGTNVVTFDGNPATVVSVTNDTTLQVTTPAGTPGLSVDVALSNDNGSDTLTGAFTYHPAPVVSSLDVTSGPAAGGTAVAITGTGFTANSAGTNVVTFDGNPATVVSVPNDTTLNVTVPAGTEGASVDVVVTNDNGSDTLMGGFSYHPAPGMVSLDVTSGPAAGGTAVTVTGSGFTSNNPGTNVVTFDGNPATIVSVPNDTTINVTVPAGTAGASVDVVVSNDNGSDTLSGGWSYHPLPSVTSLDVTTGPLAGGNPVTITGTGFANNSPGTNVVTFDGNPATVVSVPNDTTLNVTAPPGSNGPPVDVVVTNDNGSDTLSSAYTYNTPPTLTSLDVTSGPAAGGTAVALTGTGFVNNSPGTNVVTFDGNPATVVSTPNDTTINVTVPAGVAGTSVDVVITNDNGADTLTNGYGYHALPTVTSLDVTNGPAGGGTAVTITGSGFQNNSPGTNVVTFDGNPATIVSIPNDTTINVTTPAGTPGLGVDVVITNDNGADTLTSGFNYNGGPIVSSLDVTSGPAAGGTAVTITGSGFQNNSPGTNVVTFDGNPATVVSVPNDTTINVTVPAGVAGTSVDVALTNDNGADTLTNGYTYHALPTVTSLDVTSGPAAGGTAVVITGSGFTANSPGTHVVTFDGNPATVVSIPNDTTLNVTVPSGTPGASVDVVVTNDNGSATLSSGYAYHPTPTVSNIAPSAGTSLGSTSLTITGTGFQDNSPGAPTVEFGGVSATSIVVVNDTTITCDTPAGTAGSSVLFRLANNNGIVTQVGGYTYHPLPTVTSLDVTSGPAAGGTAVAITGSGFQNNSPGTHVVTFDGTPATIVSIPNDTTLNVTVPAGTPGTGDVVVTNDNGSATLTGGYTYHPLPTIASLDVTSGPAAGGTAVTITGSGFQSNNPGTNVVTFDGTPATVVSIPNDTTLNVTVPAGTPGAGDVVVTNDNGAATLTNGYTYHPLPTIVSLDVVSGDEAGGTAVTITGSGFVNNSPGTNVVTFDGVPATIVSTPNDNTLNVTTPAGSPGPADVVVTNDNGAATLSSGFSYTGPVSGSLSSVTIQPTFGLDADGAASATITVTLLDGSSNPLPGVDVQLSSSGSGNTLTPSLVTTNGSGVATATLTTTLAEIKTITAIADPGGAALELDDHPTTEFVWQIPTFYYVRTGGSDLNDGMSPATAWQTLGQAAVSVSAGDTVLIGPGTYTETVALSAAGNASNPITFQADLCGDTTGDPAGEVILDAGGGSVALTITADYNVVEGLTIRNASSNGVTLSAVQNVTLYDLVVYDNASNGILLSNSDNNTLEGCVVSNNTSHGLSLLSSDFNSMSNMLIYNNSGNGANLQSANANAMPGCTIYGNTGDGLLMFGSGGVVFENGIIALNSGDGFVRTGTANIVHDHNIVYGNSGLDYNGTSAGSNEVNSDPLFEDPDGADNVLGGAFGADDRFYLRTTPASPALDMGSVDASGVALRGTMTFAKMTSRLDDFLDGKWPDLDTVNVGYHYKAGMGVLPGMNTDDVRLSHAYWDTGAYIRPKTQTWNGTVWSSAQLGHPIGNEDSIVRGVEHRSSSLDNEEELMFVVSEDPNLFTTELDMHRWTGSKWVVDWSTTDVQTTEVLYRPFAVAYEATTGDALAVYSDNSATPVYRTWSQGSWSAEASLPLNDGGGPNPDVNSGVVRWLELEHRPGDDETSLAYVDGNDDLVAITWDGTQWVTASATLLSATVMPNLLTSNVDNRAFDIAYEHSTGDVLALWGGSDSTLYSSSKAAGSNTWSPPTVVIAVCQGQFVDLASETGTQRIAAGIIDFSGTERFSLATWNGTSWVDNATVDTSIRDANDLTPGRWATAVGWVGTSGKAVCVYTDAATNQLDSYEWTAGSGWSVVTDLPVSGMGHIESVLMASCVTQNEVIAVFTATDLNMYAATFDGTSWTLENGGSPLADVGDGSLGTDSLGFSLHVSD